jgi:hypothetical protein
MSCTLFVCAGSLALRPPLQCQRRLYCQVSLRPWVSPAVAQLPALRPGPLMSSTRSCSSVQCRLRFRVPMTLGGINLDQPQQLKARRPWSSLAGTSLARARHAPASLTIPRHCFATRAGSPWPLCSKRALPVPPPTMLQTRGFATSVATPWRRRQPECRGLRVELAVTPSRCRSGCCQHIRAYVSVRPEVLEVALFE